MTEANVADEGLRLFSIGHSNLALAELIGLLSQHDVDVVADVRSAPRSRYVPHFDSRRLRVSLAEAGMNYVFVGKELGGRPAADEFYDDDGHVLYDRLARSEPFEAGLERVIAGARQFRVAMLCSEEDPRRCHRHLLIGRVLRRRGVIVAHIRRDGSVQSEDALETGEGDQAALFTEEPRWQSPRSVPRRSS
jgi:uncharacterized protein (DUF488 family)